MAANKEPPQILALRGFLKEHRPVGHRVLHHFLSLRRPFLLRSDLLDGLAELRDQEGLEDLEQTPIWAFLRQCQEAVFSPAWLYFSLRTAIARTRQVAIHVDTMDAREASVEEFLEAKERMAGHRDAGQGWTLEIDLAPFNRDFYRLKESSSIGRGVEFLNRHLSSRLFEQLGKGDRRLLDFLSVHRYRDRQLMLNGQIEDVPDLRHALRSALDVLGDRPGETPWDDLYTEMRGLGFEAGWGHDAARVRETMELLLDILEAPSPQNIESFLGRIPMIFSIAVLSPHGYFGQTNVLGRADTGGQVVYILDQVRALETEMRTRLRAQGLHIEPQILVVTRLIPEAEGTTSDQPREPIAGTEGARILRVPFKTPDGEVVPHWISRFQVWPYLERFSHDVETELLAELGGRPDLIIGNYSDGNLVASLLSQRLHVTQCTIAHALEKTKYLYSDLYWQENDERYNFSCQFTADLIAMNTSDFIIASTYQEIAGTPDTAGQYESYRAFTMPGLYRVVDGIDVFDPKFNIVSPGADPQIYFPHTDRDRRLAHLEQQLDDLIYEMEPGSEVRGHLTDPGKPLLLTMSRMDHIKNITGLVDWYGASPELRREANLLVISGRVDADRSSDDEERGQIWRMHELMESYDLDGEVRWLGMHLEKELTGELYRYVADRRGAFVQPALFEAFGLTVVEAMVSGLPVFATCFGGPLEIIRDGTSGFLIDPTHGERAAARMTEFFRRSRKEPEHWDQVSKAAIERVEERFTWRLYAERMMTLSRIYGFWKFVTDLERAETRRYLEMFYGLQFRPLAARLLER